MEKLSGFGFGLSGTLLIVLGQGRAQRDEWRSHIRASQLIVLCTRLKNWKAQGRIRAFCWFPYLIRALQHGYRCRQRFKFGYKVGICCEESLRCNKKGQMLNSQRGYASTGIPDKERTNDIRVYSLGRALRLHELCVRK